MVDSVGLANIESSDKILHQWSFGNGYGENVRNSRLIFVVTVITFLWLAIANMQISKYGTGKKSK